MKRSSYDERDYSFGQAMLHLRTSIGLTQSGLAKYLGVSRRAVGEWEAGNSYPKGENLKQLIELGIKQQAFPIGSEAQTVRDLWQAAHQKILLDEQWLSSLLKQYHPLYPLAAPQQREEVAISEPEPVSTQPAVAGPLVDWDQALAVPSFYGREQELAQLSGWVHQEHCRVVSLLGMGGIGKSALVVRVMHGLAEHFDAVLFRSLRDAPSCEELLDDCLQVLAPQPLRVAPTSLEQRISLLLKHLRTSHTLLVLDNLESLLEDGVAWSPDGRLLASSGWDHTIRVWEPATGDCLQIVQDPDHRDTLFFGVAWSPDGHLLASGSYLQGVQVWDVTMSCRRWFGHTNQFTFRRLDWSPDGTWLAGGGDDGSVYLWAVTDDLRQQRLPGHHGMIQSVTWSPDGTQLASCGGRSDSGEQFVWDVRRRERTRTFADHPCVVSAVAWSLGGDLLVSGGSDGMLRWWEEPCGKCIRMRQAHLGAIRSLRSSPDGHRLASCGDDGAIRIWDLHSGEYLRTLRRDRPYERLDITGIRGLTDAKKSTLRALGAREEETM
jgi:transcriptional regulator with XRE-family HTH domain